MDVPNYSNKYVFPINACAVIKLYLPGQAVDRVWLMSHALLTLVLRSQG